MELIRKDLEATNQEKGETKEKLDGIQAQIEAVELELQDLYAKKDEKREAYWKARYDFKVQDNEIQHIQWMQRQKDKILQHKALMKEREEEKKSVINSLPHPYLKEIDCCEHLIGYIHATKVKMGLIVDNETAAR